MYRVEYWDSGVLGWLLSSEVYYSYDQASASAAHQQKYSILTRFRVVKKNMETELWEEVK